MKEKVSPGRKTGSTIVKNLIVLLAVVVAAFSGIYSWFTESKVFADGINIKCEKPEGISLAVVPHNAEAPKDSDYTTEDNPTINLNEREFVKNLNLTDVTSNGTEGSFYKQPATVSGNNYWTKADVNSDYLSFDLYFRSIENYNISICEDSYLRPQSNVDTVIMNKNSQPFKDCIAGASRISILDENSTEQRLLWIPAPNIWYDRENNKIYTNIESSTKISGKNIGELTRKHEFYDGKANSTQATTYNSPNLVASVKDSDSGKYIIGENKLITSLGNYKQTFNGISYYVNHVTVNMWIEGTDAESHKDLLGGKFDLFLKFSVG